MMLNSEHYYKAGLADLDNKEFARAVKHFSKAVEKEPGLAKAYYRRGVAKSLLGDPGGAMPDLAKAIEIDPEYCEAYVERACIYGRQNDYIAAVEQFTKAINLRPGISILWAYRGYCYGQLHDYHEAICNYDVAIGLNINKIDRIENTPADLLKYNPGCLLERMYFNRGLNREFIQNFRSAIADYSIAIRINPGLATALYRRGLCKIKLGNIASGNTDIGRAKELGYDEEEAKDIF